MLKKEDLLLENLRLKGRLREQSRQMKRLCNNLQKTYLNTITALASAIDAKDGYTNGHSDRLSRYAVIIATALRLGESRVKAIEYAAKLHDIGKIATPDYILNKPGKLTEDEWREMKAHALRGAAIIEPLEFLKGVVPVVRHHHERFDGKGYPSGLRGKRIMLEARILAVADAFEAMTTNRPYQKARGIEKAKEELEKNKNSQFDPKVVDVFLRVLGNGSLN
ncbi:MAG: HD-GYP domain-containing protein [Candidatus Omnitrophica bacterium]|nr:HD-GYP domain-containing protein [Candidatus Omnitrophota bacterium]